jgi:urease accessory protein
MPRLRASSAPTPLSASALLQLIWLASPALPVGGFSYSEGLEPAIEAAGVSDEASASHWLVDQLQLALGRADLPVVARAFGAWQRMGQAAQRANAAGMAREAARITALNDWVRHTRESSEFRQQTEQMGRSLHDWLRQRHPDDARLATVATLAPAPTWPVVHALASVLTGAPARQALLAHAFGWAENMTQAAIKCVPLGQSAGQRILARLADAIPAVVDTALRQPEADRQAFTPMLAILSAQHEAQYSRLFRS